MPAHGSRGWERPKLQLSNSGISRLPAHPTFLLWFDTACGAQCENVVFGPSRNVGIEGIGRGIPSALAAAGRSPPDPIAGAILRQPRAAPPGPAAGASPRELRTFAKGCSFASLASA